MTDGLVVTGLKVKYRGAPAVRDATLRVPHGALVGMAGRNGAGKTSTLRAISGLVHRDGSVSLDGVSLPNRPEAVAQMGVAHVPEGRGLFPGMTVKDNLRLACAALGCDESNIEELLEDGDAFQPLKPLLQRRAGHLSGGEQQLVAVARGLVVRPKIVLIDELSLGLSPIALMLVLRAVTSASERHGIGVLLIDQNIRALIRTCETVYVMFEGVSREATGMGEEELDRLYMN